MSMVNSLTAAIGAIILLAITLIYLGASEGDRLKAAASGYHGRSIEIGAGLYELHCRTCHGTKGEGVGQLGPPLSDAHFFENRLKEIGWQSTLEDYILATTEHGRLMGSRPIYAGNGSTAVMPPWARRYGGPLRPDEIRAVGDFVMNWERSALGEVTLVELEIPIDRPRDGGAITRGEAVFVEHCVSCHRYRNQQMSGQSGPELTELAVNARTTGAGLEPGDYIRESILNPLSVITEGFEKVALEQPCGSVVTESELEAVTSFLLQ